MTKCKCENEMSTNSVQNCAWTSDCPDYLCGVSKNEKQDEKNSIKQALYLAIGQEQLQQAVPCRFFPLRQETGWDW
jgi:hypothetical protein